MVSKTFVLTYVVIQTTMSYTFTETPQYRRECMDQLNITEDLAPFKILTNAQMRDLQCLDRCMLIKRGVIDQNETLQEAVLNQQFPNIDTDVNMTNFCPIIANLTDKCEKASLILKCLQHQRKPWEGPKRMHPPPPPPPRRFKMFPPDQGRQYRGECMREVAGEIQKSNDTSNFDRKASRLHNQWCVDRCIMIKMGFLNENNTIMIENVSDVYKLGEEEIRKCEAFKDEDECKTAADFGFCLNRLSQFQF